LFREGCRQIAKAVRPPVLPTLAAAERMVLRLFLHAERDGILIAVTHRFHREALLAKVLDALSLIEATNAPCYQRLRATTGQLLVASATTQGYSRWTGTGWLASRIVDRDTTMEVAATIVYEIAYARLARVAIRPLSRARRSRVFIACVGAQIRFIRSLPREKVGNTERHLDLLNGYITRATSDAA
jgi:hypothetical protein